MIDVNIITILLFIRKKTVTVFLVIDLINLIDPCEYKNLKQ